ncbi:MAG: DEAD/DEAH box helicase family protein [Romboutsia timonensis]|uniref:DEAD/DEAH box helicase family protein n=1 Tax=Romboutsia timonensis TaxID=1776391 RepID=UPI002A74AC9E|nr:DEAD/DEAH box helicase family protein [Romboutsia timonensis]MDY2883425.1 DEAD/DEAH box helicase family protein [Romboutsia timonensis]
MKNNDYEFNNEYPQIPENIQIRPYQEEAIKKWFDNRLKGIFQMATGTGKTITAISAITRLLNLCKVKKLSCGIIIVVPYKSLLEQWVETLRLFKINPIKCYESKNIWFDKLNKKIEFFNFGITKTIYIITTNATFNSESFQESISKIQKDYVLCIDEMHHAATDKYLLNLPEKCIFRLGLSATLESNYNIERTNELVSYFGGIVYEFSMKRAIEEGFLTPYYYYPIFIELSEYEKEEYFMLSKKIGRLINVCDKDDECLTSLLMKRSRILGSAENKLKELIKLKTKVKNTNYNIFYCGDTIDENDDKFIYKVNRIVANELELKTHTFTSEEDKNERKNILERFKQGDLQAITAIRCLDEGIDIPELRRAFILSSSTNPKEFIQRRGRILRKSKSKEYAEIYDFIVVASLDKRYINELTDEELIVEKKIFLRELDRFVEFASLSINEIESHNKLMQIWDLYD